MTFPPFLPNLQLRAVQKLLRRMPHQIRPSLQLQKNLQATVAKNHTSLEFDNIGCSLNCQIESLRAVSVSS